MLVSIDVSKCLRNTMTVLPKTFIMSLEEHRIQQSQLAGNGDHAHIELNLGNIVLHINLSRVKVSNRLLTGIIQKGGRWSLNITKPIKNFINNL